MTTAMQNDNHSRSWFVKRVAIVTVAIALVICLAWALSEHSALNNGRFSKTEYGRTVLDTRTGKHFTSSVLPHPDLPQDARRESIERKYGSRVRGSTTAADGKKQYLLRDGRMVAE